MNVKQFLCAGMTGALLVAGLTACAPGAPEVDPSDVAYQTAGVTRDTVLFTVDGTEVTADEYLFWLLQSVASAKQSGYLADDDAWEEELNGVPTAEYLKEDARNTSVLYTTVSNHAAAAGLTVTEEEQAEADAELETLTQRVDSYYGMTLQEYLDQQCISEAAFRKLNQVPYLARSLQTQMEEAGRQRSCFSPDGIKTTDSPAHRYNGIRWCLRHADSPCWCCIRCRRNFPVYSYMRRLRRCGIGRL